MGHNKRIVGIVRNLRDANRKYRKVSFSTCKSLDRSNAVFRRKKLKWRSTRSLIRSFLRIFGRCARSRWPNWNFRSKRIITWTSKVPFQLLLALFYLYNGIIRELIACELGRFYNKESVIELLLDRHTLAGKFPPEMHKKSMHIRNMKDIIELVLVINPNHKKELTPVTMLNGSSTVAGTEDGSPYHCPITGLEMNGRYRFVFFLTCGCVVSG